MTDERLFAFKRLTIEHIWCLTVLVGIFAFVNTHPIRPQDFWWHLAVGREILTTGVIPTVDTFSYTAIGQPYLSYQMFWLMEVLMYGIYHLGGAALVLLAHSLVITGAYTLITIMCWKIAGNGRAAAMGTLFAAALGLNDWNVRPQGVTFLLGALIIWAIYQLRTTGRFTAVPRRYGWLLVFPLVMAVWVNSHGTFAIGIIFIGVWLLEEFLALGRSVIPGLLALLLSCLACLFNPRGLGIIAYLSGMASNPIIQNLVPEWAPPTFNTLDGALFLGGLLLSAAVLAISPRRPSPGQLISFIGFAALGLKTSRGEVWFGLVMAPILADHLTAIASHGRFLSAISRRGQTPQGQLPALWINWILAGLLLLMAFVSLPWFKESLPYPPPKVGLISTETPVLATRFLVAHNLPRPIFHAMSFGSYLIWMAQPDYKVFVDSRLELYAPRTWQDYIEISNAQNNWEERLETYGIQTLMLSPTEQLSLIQSASVSSNWQQVYADKAAVIFVRLP